MKDIDASQNVTVLELLDRVLNKGVVIAGDITISVADIDLLYIGAKLLLSSVDTMEQHKKKHLEVSEIEHEA
ncbi:MULTISPECIES: gas vesicle protein [unclassified Prosthecochloris]|uniref:gas vesicle protein n=1 Tax=unclassified Prosthecochloris TaxID=2632826 RepID=UPI00223D669D|nr:MULTISPECIES: gas vesicle protein [unclassified Prosthecochloris]UZJ37380.1 gas vesicle protein [Prosthecochloris sp. SCSIO W1103]UZJ39202.1 gas vesicle protein [Prosthecochloris sp. SCSIO W1102]